MPENIISSQTTSDVSAFHYVDNEEEDHSFYPVTYCLFCFNIVFFMTGMVMAGAAIWMKLPFDGTEPVIGYHAFDASWYIMMFLGAFIIMLSIVSWWISIYRPRMLVTTYGYGISISLVLEVVLATMALLSQKDFMYALKRQLWQSVMDLYGKPDYHLITYSMDHIQNTFNCCGVINYTDWLDSYWYREVSKFDANIVPWSCCFPDPDFPAGFGTNASLCGDAPDQTMLVYNLPQIKTLGCYYSLTDQITAFLKVVTGIGYATAVIHVNGYLIVSFIMTTLIIGPRIMSHILRGSAAS